MATTNNKRIYYAIQQATIGGQAIKGLQTVGIQTSFNLEQVFEMGQLEIYQNLEEVPEVEVSLNKVLDGSLLIYCLATETGANGINDSVAQNAKLTGRQNARCDFELSIYPDSQTAAAGNSIANNGRVLCGGMYVSSVSYTFGVDGNFTEDVTLVGNDKTWDGSATGAFSETSGETPPADSKVNRRQHLDVNNCLFPAEIVGTFQDLSSTGEGFSTHFQNITVSCDLGRESINELGRFAPYHRYATFPVEVTAEFEVLATEGDGIQASENGFYTGDGTMNGSSVAPAEVTDACQYRYNLRDQAIRLVTCEGTTIDLGDKCKLSSVNYTGGDTGGGNVTVTYSYTTYNDFTVVHTSSALFTALPA